MVRWSRSRNFASLAGESLLMPSDLVAVAPQVSMESLKSHACVVQPGVIAAG